ncbi:MAG: sporulation integral membrane protein YtvI [Bacillota bacterium]
MKELGVSFLYVVAVIAVAYVAGKFIIPLTWPFVIALVLAYMIDPPVTMLEKKVKLNRSLAVSVVLLSVTLLITGLVSLGVSRLLVEVSELAIQVPTLQAKLIALMEQVTRELSRYLPQTPVGMEMLIRGQLDRISGWVEWLLGQILNRVAVVPGIVAGIIVVIVATFFMSRDKSAINRELVRLVPKELRQRVTETQAEIVTTIVRIVSAQVKLVVFTTVITIVGFEIIGSKYAVVLGLLCGLLDVLPILGPALVFVPWAIACFVTGEILRGVALLGLYGGICLWRQAAQARLVGESIGVHPLTTLIALYVGVKVLGLLGLIIGPLVVLIIKVMAKRGVFPIIKRGKDGTV